VAIIKSECNAVKFSDQVRHHGLTQLSAT
jgi:hypothetical protein